MKRWDTYFMDMALRSAQMSKDPSTRVGAVLVKPAFHNRKPSVIGTGFNGFPHGVEDTFLRWNDRPTKLDLVVHAEMNAVLAAAAMGIPTAGSTLYVAACTPTGELAWGGPPCVRCLVECMQAGVIEYVSWPKKFTPSRWHHSLEVSHKLIEEAGLAFREVTP